MANRAKFLDFLDMIDGGGAGQMGGEFQGGGILSEIANMIATPYGSEDPRRRARRRKALGLLDKIGTKEEQAAAASRAAATPSVVKRSVPAVTSSPRPQLRPAGFGQTVQAQQEAAMGLDPFGGAGPQVTDPRNFQRGTEPSVLTAAQRAAVTRATPRVTSDPRGFAPNTQPSVLTQAQKEAILMAQPVAPLGFDPRQFNRGSQPSTLTPRQASVAQGILSRQKAAQAALPSGLPPQAPVSLQPSDAMPVVTSTPISPAPASMQAPSPMSMPSSPSPMLEGPRPANEDMVMFTKMMGSVPEGAGDLNTQEYRDYVLGGGRLPYLEYEKTKPEYIATQQLAQQYETFYMMPIEEQMRLINERADIIRRETPKPMPFTGPAF